MRIITVDNKEYNIAVVTFSQESIELLEKVAQFENGNATEHDAVQVLSLAYNAAKDCLMRGGSVANEDEAKAVLAKIPLDGENIRMLIGAISGHA